ncbi:carbohydrate sulfotransferase 11-like [Patiria miniata]|uniref:Carbohydrate sulfotransferase n=1 Tax=Patiria miniata TaxID=46514 RepID=A0A914ABN8_PATMI|nr:carbohydrate sulfotransferase 11-like [Patiria miniata]
MGVCGLYNSKLSLLICIFCLIVFCVLTWTKMEDPTSFKPRQINDQHRVDFGVRVTPSQSGTPLDGGPTQQQNDFQKRRESQNAGQKEQGNGEISEPYGFMEQQAVVQSERRRHLREVCSNHPELSQGSINAITLRNLFVQHKSKIIFCAVPKNGCSNWKRVAMVLGGVYNQTEDIPLREAHMDTGLKRLIQLSPAERNRTLQTYTKFMYARQPFLRLLSAYLDKFEGKAASRQGQYLRDIAKGIMRRYRKNATTRDLQTGENITWYEWMTYLTNQTERADFDPHWLEIHKLCSPCQINYDYMGKLETVDDDARYMLTSLEVQDKVNFPTGDEHQTNSSQAYSTYFGRVTMASLQRLWEVYKLDFELFGYDNPSPFL